MLFAGNETRLFVVNNSADPGNSAYLDPLDARIAELEQELRVLRSQKLQMWPPPVANLQTLESVFSSDTPGTLTQKSSVPLDLSTMPPPVEGSQIHATGRTLNSTRPLPSSLSGAQVVLALGGAVLAAATISFGAFMWPRLTSTMRVLVLSLVVAALGVAAVFVKQKLNALAESLAVGSAASLLVLMLLWYNARAGSLESAGGVGLILLVYALITGVASLLSKLKSWEYIASGFATFSVLVLCNFDIDPYLVSGVGALVLGVIAWRLLWPHLLWGSGLLGAVSVVLLSDKLSDLSLPRELPFALILVVLALTYNRVDRAPVELQQSLRYIGAGFVAASGIASLVSTFGTIDDPSAGVRDVLVLAGGVLVLLVHALITGDDRLLSKLKPWEYVASGFATFSVVVLCNLNLDPYLVSGVSALVLGVIAWRLLLWHLIWCSGILGAASVVLISDKLSDLSLPRELPFALILVVLALTYNRAGRAPVELHHSLRYVGAGFVAISGIASLFSTFEIISGSSTGVVERIGAVLILASAAFFSNKVPRLRDATKPLLLLALVVAASGLAPLWLGIAVVIAYLLYPTDISVVVFAVAMACTAGAGGSATTDLITGGSPTWFILALAAVLPFAWSLKTKLSELVLLGGALASGSVLVATENVTTELRTLPVALVLALCWALAKWMQPVLVTTWFLAPSIAIALSATTYYAVDGVGSDMLWRTAVVAGISSVLVAAGVKWKLGGVLVPGFVALCLVVIARILDVTASVPVWIPLIGAAVVLLVAGARFEYLETQRKRTLHWARDLR